MKKYIIEYWKAGLPHQVTTRYIKGKVKNIYDIPFIDYIMYWYYRINVYDHNKNLIISWECD